MFSDSSAGDQVFVILIMASDKLRRRIKLRLVWVTLWTVVATALSTAACSPRPAAVTMTDTDEPLKLPVIEPMAAAGDKLQVLATTSIIGDVVRQVGGEAIDLTVLMQPGHRILTVTSRARPI